MDASAGAVEVSLIGGAGKEYVADALSAQGPKVGMQTIKAQGNLSHPLCTPLMAMVDQMGIPRLDAHRAVLQAAKASLLQRVQRLDGRNGHDKVKLERLLGSSFVYLGMSELREVPLAVMDKLEQVPSVWLKQLAVDKEIFRDLPARVQRQVWEFDKNLLQSDALPLVGQYKYEIATYMRALACDEFIPGVLARDAESAAGSEGMGGLQQGRPAGITRKILRKGSKVIQALKGMVGTSAKIYNQVVELCVVKFRDTSELYVGLRDSSYCTLRSQLLMSLHDDSNPVAVKDKCHELAWTLDAGIKNGLLSEKHLEKLEKYFVEVCKADGASKAKGKSVKGVPQDEAESAGNISGSLVEPLKVLGEAGTILRDPSAMHMLASQALALLREVTTAQQLPSQNARLVFVLRLLQLAVECRHMLRDRKYRFPEADPVILTELLPMLAGCMVDFEISGSPEPNSILADVEVDWPDKGTRDRCCQALRRNEVARRLVHTFVLERLARKDFLSATKVLRLVVEQLSPASMMEVADFAATLAQRLAELVKERRLLGGSRLWSNAVDNLLIRAVDTHTQTHEEVLRLLRDAATPAEGRPQLLTPQELGSYLQHTLDNSKQSRKRYKKHHADDVLAGFPMLLASDIGSDIGSDGWPGIMQLKIKGADGVRSVYEFFKRVPGMNPAAAPALYAYLQEDTH